MTILFFLMYMAVTSGIFRVFENRNVPFIALLSLSVVANFIVTVIVSVWLGTQFARIKETTSGYLHRVEEARKDIYSEPQQR